jgi:hypothetical protein
MTTRMRLLLICTEKGGRPIHGGGPFIATLPWMLDIVVFAVCSCFLIVSFALWNWWFLFCLDMRYVLMRLIECICWHTMSLFVS